VTRNSDDGDDTVDGTLVVVSGVAPEPLYGIIDDRSLVEVTRSADEWRVTVRCG
jgi:hypothetical protein